MSDNIVKRITAYLAGGGLFNPELANHDAVRDLLIDARAAVTEERDAIAARLAPVEDEELVEIVAREIAFAQGDVESPNSEFMDENWHCWEPEARAAIAAIRPHIEAAERERCAKIADKQGWCAGSAVVCGPEIAAAIRSGK